MKYSKGMIIGRFQPFHSEHLRYFRLAWEHSERIFVGITNPDPSAIKKEEHSAHRHLPKENPFTYTERLVMIHDTLCSEGYPMERIYIAPVPIHHPERWRYYIPKDTVVFIVAYSDWEREKADRIRTAGYDVVEIDSLQKGISGQQVRALLRSKGDWESLVPQAVAQFIRNLPENGL